MKFSNGLFPRGIAKACAGIINYNFMLLLLFIWIEMMSFLILFPPNFQRKFNFVSLRARKMHVFVSIVAFVTAIIHSIAHLGGTFIFLDKMPESILLDPVLSQKDFFFWAVIALPGWTGWITLALFFAIFLTSVLRRRIRFEIFSLSHKIIWPILIIMLSVHGLGGYFA
jgi:hypothetical protein